MSIGDSGPINPTRSLSQRTGADSAAQTGRAATQAIRVESNGTAHIGEMQILTAQDKSLQKAMELQRKEIAKAFRIPFADVQCDSEAEFQAYLNPLLQNWKDARDVQRLAEGQVNVAEHLAIEADTQPMQSASQDRIRICKFASTDADTLQAGQRTHESWNALKASDDAELRMMANDGNNRLDDATEKQLKDVMLNDSLPLTDLVHVPCHAGGHCALIALAASQGLSQTALEAKLDNYQAATDTEKANWKNLKVQVRASANGIDLEGLKETHFYRATGIPEITQIAIRSDSIVSFEKFAPKSLPVPRPDSLSEADSGQAQSVGPQSVGPPVVLIWRNNHFDLLTTMDWAQQHGLPTGKDKYVDRANP